MPPASPDSQPLLFLVEDEADTADLVTLILREQGYLVVHAADGHETLDKLVSMPVPALVLLDIQLPHVDGIGVLETIRATPSWRDIPVVLLTSVVDPLCIHQAVSLKVQDYLLKPVKRDTLLRYVQRALMPSTGR